MGSKVILVTGANKGIGLAVVEALLKLKHTVILSSRDKEKGMEAYKSLKSKGDLYYHQLDVSDQSSINDIFNFVSEKFKRLDVLINNAGINYDTWHDTTNADLEEVYQTIDTNLMGPWKLSQIFIPLMKQHKYGRIVHVSSGAGAISGMTGGTPGYSISKAALNVLTIKMGIELKDSGILVNAVCPGWVRTDMGGQEAPRNVEEGANSVIWAGLLEANGPSGKFFRDGAEIPF